MKLLKIFGCLSVSLWIAGASWGQVPPIPMEQVQCGYSVAGETVDNSTACGVANTPIIDFIPTNPPAIPDLPDQTLLRGPYYLPFLPPAPATGNSTVDGQVQSDENCVNYGLIGDPNAYGYAGGGGYIVNDNLYCGEPPPSTYGNAYALQANWWLWFVQCGYWRLSGSNNCYLSETLNNPTGLVNQTVIDPANQTLQSNWWPTVQTVNSTVSQVPVVGSWLTFYHSINAILAQATYWVNAQYSTLSTITLGIDKLLSPGVGGGAASASLSAGPVKDSARAQVVTLH